MCPYFSSPHRACSPPTSLSMIVVSLLSSTKRHNFIKNTYFTEPWWLSGLERQSNSSPCSRSRVRIRVSAFLFWGDNIWTRTKINSRNYELITQPRFSEESEFDLLGGFRYAYLSVRIRMDRTSRVFSENTQVDTHHRPTKQLQKKVADAQPSNWSLVQSQISNQKRNP